MKNDTQPDATPYKGFSKHCILCGLAALIGATIAVIVIFGVAPRYAYIFEPRCDIASHFIPSAALSSAKVDPAWRLIIRDMVDSAALQAETRLRDHFTLLLAMAGMGTAIILGVFSISQARREEKALSEMKELKIEAKDILAEIRECRETAHTLTDKIDGGYVVLKNLAKDDFENGYEDTFRNKQTRFGEQTSERKDRGEVMVQLMSDSSPLNSGLRVDGEQGDAVASFALAQMYKTGKGIEQNDVKAAECYLKAAEQGYAKAQFNLGMMYRRGEGVEQSDVKAVEWYLKAAEQGDIKAQFSLAVMYSKGKGVEQNDVKAAEWYFKAAKQGYAKAQFNLACMYDNGRGVEQSDIKAAEWYLKAAKQGHINAQFNLAVMYQDGQGIEQSNVKAAEWYLKAAEQGDGDAQFNLACMYDNGEGVEQSDVEAAKWYLKAAEQGDAKAQFNLALMYRRGEGVEQSDIKALKWYRKAAEQGDMRAQLSLGRLYEQGIGTDPDQQIAAFWYLKAAEQGHVLATLEMSSRYFNGKGVPENYIKAYTFLLLYKCSKNGEQNDTEEQELQQALAKLLTPEQIAVAQKDAAMLWEKIKKSEN